MPSGEGSGLSEKAELRLMVVVMSYEIWKYWEDPKVEAVEAVVDSKRESWSETLESFQGRSRRMAKIQECRREVGALGPL